MARQAVSRPAPAAAVSDEVAAFRARLAASIGRIDLDNLREEITTAGAYTDEYGDKTAKAKTRASMAKLNFEVTEAKLGREIRTMLEANAERATDAAVRDRVRVDPRYSEAARQLYEAQEEADKTESLKYVLVQKARTLQELVSLLIREEDATREGRTYERSK